MKNVSMQTEIIITCNYGRMSKSKLRFLCEETYSRRRVTVGQLLETVFCLRSQRGLGRRGLGPRSGSARRQ